MTVGTSRLLGAGRPCRVAGLCICLALGGGLVAQEPGSTPAADGTASHSKADPVQVRIGPEHVAAREARYPVRSEIAGQGAVVKFSPSLAVEQAKERPPPPDLNELVGDPELQTALDDAAKPGDWVTPPAARR